MVVLACLSCATIYGQTDDFRQTRLEKGCRTEPECKSLVDAASLRASGCGENELGKIRCADASRDLAEAERMQRDVVNVRLAREEKERRDEVLRASEKQSEDRKADVRRHDEEQRAKEATREQQSMNMTALTDCRRTASFAACAAPGLDAAHRAECEASCKQYGDRQALIILHRVQEDCMRRYADGAGAKASCEFKGSDGEVAPWTPPSTGVRCDAVCRANGAKLVAWTNVHVLCCDKTRSPTCMNGSWGRGCCSSHGGVCAESEPSYDAFPTPAAAAP